MKTVAQARLLSLYTISEPSLPPGAACGCLCCSQPPKPGHRSLVLGRSLPANAVVVTDQPWGVAWYADRITVWLPEAPIPSRQAGQNLKLEEVADLRGPGVWERGKLD